MIVMIANHFVMDRPSYCLVWLIALESMWGKTPRLHCVANWGKMPTPRGILPHIWGKMPMFSQILFVASAKILMLL